MNRFSSLNTKLIKHLTHTDLSLGLAEGKMGFCIYFYCLGSIYDNNEYRKTAADLLDDIFENIGSSEVIDVKNGLAGIGLAINYLIKKEYVQGNINNILRDIDDIIFKKLSYAKYCDKIDSLSLIQILYYLYVRLKDLKSGSENEYLFRELIIKTINNLYESLSPQFFHEPLNYKTDYALPQLLLILSKIYELNFYNNRVTKIIEEISYNVLSTFPILHSNRLYLLWAMNKLNMQINDLKWQKHIILLKENIDIDLILNDELKNKNIYFNDGFTSIHYCLNHLQEYFNQNELMEIKNRIFNKINSSEALNLLNENQQYFEKHLGLYGGFTGVSLLFHELQTADR